MEMTTFIKTMPVLKFPRNIDTAILRSNDSLRSEVRDHSFYIFTQIGQNARGWFDFLTDTQIVSNQSALDKYKIVYVADLEYSRPETAEKLIEFVENGGILICGEPLVFEHNINAESMVEYRRKLLGVDLSGKIKNPGAFKFTDNKWHVKTLENTSVSYKISKIDDNVKVIAEFSDGSPAITEKYMGKGRAVYFASQPFDDAYIADVNWKAFMKELHISLGGSIDHKIWRFKIPEKLFPSDNLEINEVRDSLCLTGNFGFWDRFVFTAGERYNVQNDGEYFIESGKRLEKFTFKKGPLTNRLNVLTAPIAPGRVDYASSFISKFNKDEWIEEFRSGEKKYLTFDLKNIYSIKLLRVYFSDKYPDMIIETSLDRITWRSVTAINSGLASGPENVNFIDIEIPGSFPSRFLRIKSDGKFHEKAIIPEIEIWGKTATPSSSL